MIGIGFLVKLSPNMMAGYNTMSEEKKKNVDIEGLSTYMRNGFVAIGLTLIISYYFFKWIGLTLIADSMIVIVILVGITILMINASKFDHNRDKKTKLTYLIPAFLMVLVAGLMAYGYMPSRPIFEDDTIRFSGMYGFETNIAEIENVTLIDKLPKINMRTNGFSFGAIKKGTFNLDQSGKCRLLIHSELPPYLVISKINGEKIFINFKDKTDTEKTFNRIKTLTDK